MKCRKWLATILLGLSVGAIANTDMSKSFNEAREVGKLNNSNAQSILRDFQPTKELDNFQSRPAESNHYKGIRGNPDLSSKGMQSLNTSEVGKSIRESTINNPKVEISEDSDFIQNSNNIRKNADIISGIKNSKQCVNQVLSKTSFTYHHCEKDQQINRICKKTADVKWTGKKVVDNKEYSFTLKTPQSLADFRSKYGNDRIVKEILTLPESGVVTGFEIISPYVGGGYYTDLRRNKMNIEFLGVPFTLGMRDDKSFYIKTDLINQIKVKANEAISLWVTSVTGWFRNRVRGKTFYIKIYMQVEIDNLGAEIEWVDSCRSFDLENAISLGEKCTQSGGVRNFFRDGKTVALHSECWEKQIEYLVSDASDNECKKYDNDPNCTAGERECILKLGNDCIRHRIKYQCSKTVKTDGYICGDKFFCSDGSCADLEQSVNSDFGHAVSQLATLAQAGKDVSLDDINLRAFSGRPMFCRKSGFGFSDCCKDSGWGHNLHLAKCNSEENALGQAKEKDLTIFVGTYCDKRVLKKCVRRKSSYCVFDNKLARIIQAQGRSGQLGIGFGGAKSPDCRGLNVDELQRIDFNAMDYSDFYEDLEANKEIPDKDRLIEYMRKSITNQLQQ